MGKKQTKKLLNALELRNRMAMTLPTSTKLKQLKPQANRLGGSVPSR